MEIFQLSQTYEGQDLLIALVWLFVGGASYLAFSNLHKYRRSKYRSPMKPITAHRFPETPSDFKSPELKRTSENTPSAAAGGNLNSDYVEQLRHVMGASFRKKRVMNRSEFRVFRIVEEELRAVRGGHRILSQTCLGEILDSDNKAAFASINAKRVDILIIQPNGEPLAVFEYQGQGHYQNMAAARDAVKKEALRSAGVHYLEINEHHEPEEIRHMVRKLVNMRS